MCRKLMKAVQDLHAKNKAFRLSQDKTEVVALPDLKFYSSTITDQVTVT